MLAPPVWERNPPSNRDETEIASNRRRSAFPTVLPALELTRYVVDVSKLDDRPSYSFYAENAASMIRAWCQKEGNADFSWLNLEKLKKLVDGTLRDYHIGVAPFDQPTFVQPLPTSVDEGYLIAVLIRDCFNLENLTKTLTIVYRKGTKLDSILIEPTVTSKTGQIVRFAKSTWNSYWGTPAEPTVPAITLLRVNVQKKQLTKTKLSDGTEITKPGIIVIAGCVLELFALNRVPNAKEKSLKDMAMLAIDKKTDVAEKLLLPDMFPPLGTTPMLPNTTASRCMAFEPDGEWYFRENNPSIDSSGPAARKSVLTKERISELMERYTLLQQQQENE